MLAKVVPVPALKRQKMFLLAVVHQLLQAITKGHGVGFGTLQLVGSWGEQHPKGHLSEQGGLPGHGHRWCDLEPLTGRSQPSQLCDTMQCLVKQPHAGGVWQWEEWLSCPLLLHPSFPTLTGEGGRSLLNLVQLSDMGRQWWCFVHPE